MKKIFFIIMILICCKISFAQGVYNDGAKILIQSGAVVYVTGNNGNYRNETHNSSDGSVILDGAIKLTKDWTNNATAGGAVASASTGEAVFDGSAQTIGGSSATAFYDLTLSNSGVKTFTTVPTVNGILSMEGTATASAVPAYGSNVTLQYAGSAAQTTGVEFPSTFNGSGGVIINNSNGVTLGSSKSITNGLNIATGALTIPPTIDLTVTGTTTLNSAECLVINDGGSFIDNGITGTGTARVEKYLSASSGRWWYIGLPLSSPVNASVFGTISTVASTDVHLYYWDEPSHAYTQITNGSDVLAPTNPYFRGYSVKNYAGDINAAFIGSLNTGTVINSNITLTTGSEAGYNLVYNPYPSAIDWGNIDGSDNPTGLVRSNVGLSIWYPNGNNGFSTYNGQSGAAVSEDVVPVTQYIPAMQAFWVLVPSGTSGTLSMDNTIRLHNSQSFYKTTSSLSNNLFRIVVSRDTLNDEAAVGFYPNAYDFYEAYDSKKMFSTGNDYPQIYTLTTDSIQVVINGFPVLAPDTERIVPLGFLTNVAGTDTLRATNLSNFDPTISVYLEDVQLSILQDLRLNNIYTFTSGVVNNASRFRLHFSNISTNISNTAANTSILIYTVNNAVYVNTPQKGNGIIELYDMLGRKIMSQQSVQGLNKLQPYVNRGIYIVKVQNNDSVINKKVYLY